MCHAITVRSIIAAVKEYREAMLDKAKLTYSIEEAAQLLGIGRNTCYEAVARGEIPVIRIGPKRLLIPKAALDRLLAEAGREREPVA